MLQNIDQMPLETRIPALRDMALLCRSKKEQCAKEEAEFLDELARAESQLGGRTDIPKSGLIEHNPYATGTPPIGEEGDAVDPATGKSSGDDPPTGSEPSHHSTHRHAKKS